MKPAYYLLAIILLLVAGIAALVLIGQRSQPVSVPAKREVYVDLGRLVGHHPAHGALKVMASSLLLGSPSCASARPMTIGPMRFPPNDGLADSQTRQQLEASNARAAVSALSRLETVRDEALRARLRVKRADMIENSAAGYQAALDEIESQRSAAIGRVTGLTAYERINDMLRVSALKTQTKVPFMDQRVIGASIASAKDQLGILEDQTATERRKIEREFRKKIEDQTRLSEAKISDVISALESEGRQQIEEDISHARGALLSDLSDRYGFEAQADGPNPRFAPTAQRPDTRVPLACVGPTGAPSTSASVAVVEASLRRSVARTVEAIAGRRGLKVSFSAKSGLPDETTMMLRLMRQGVWRSYSGSAGAGG